MSLMPALHRVAGTGRGLESAVAAAAILAMAVLPVAELALRPFGASIPGSHGFVQHLTLWVAFVGAMVAARERRHLTLSTGLKILPDPLSRRADMFAVAATTAVSAGLCWASLQFVRAELEFPMGGHGMWVPVWLLESIMPLAFAVMTLRFILQAEGRGGKLAGLAGPPLAAVIGLWLVPAVPGLALPLVGLLLLAAVLGAPIFVVIGGAALVLFVGAEVPIAAVPVETYRIVVSPSIPAIPLFTLAGYLLAEGRAGDRLVHLFRALFGWLPGGLPIVTTLVCAFFTTFTGASGATILALGGLLLPVLVRNMYGERFSLGLLTATGSIGLLFPPSLAVILYAVIARIPIPDLFVAGIVPGAIMVGAVCLYGVWRGHVDRTPRRPFDGREALAALNEAKWEIALPVVVLTGIFGGYGTLVELSAVTVVYVLLVGVLVHRDLTLARNVPQGILECVTLIGGVFTILGVAMGLTNYFVDAQVPMLAADWVEAHIESKLVFLLALNVFLLIVGCLMDIYSAIAVVVPLILPIAAAFGIHPLHLGIIFLANLELGYLTPPVGMNLFLAAYRFDKPVVEIWRAALPFLGLLALVVLLVTYVPAIIIGVPG
ncbi:MAG: TRAP transporter large permease subunit [Rhodospirillales bacterium]|nr:MAG: TRAP transporter large permease subunit [Rhodospirillales bacterium]